MAPCLGVICAHILLHLNITAPMLMVVNHLQCAVLNLGRIVEMFTLFEECSKYYMGHSAYIFSSTHCYDSFSLEFDGFTH